MVDGDFVMTEAELQPVLKALRRADLPIVAIHQHMTGEEPLPSCFSTTGASGPRTGLQRRPRGARRHDQRLKARADGLASRASRRLAWVRLPSR